MGTVDERGRAAVAGLSYARAARTVSELIRRVPVEAWRRPALGEWDVRALVGHTAHAGLITVNAVLQRPANREDITSGADYYALPPTATGEGDDTEVAARGHDAGRELGDEPAAAVARLVDEVVGRAGAMAGDDLVATPAGGMRVEAYLDSRIPELVVHAVDLTRALDLPWAAPPDLLAEVVVTLARTGVARGHGPELLHALTGRDRLSPDFRVV